VERGAVRVDGLSPDELAVVEAALPEGWAVGDDDAAVMIATTDEALQAAQQARPVMARLRIADPTTASQAVARGGVAHEFLFRPLSVEAVREALSRATTVSAVLDDERLRTLVSELGPLPALPSTYQALCAVLVSDTASVRDAARVIERDVAVSTRVLQLVNSALYALPRRVGSLEQAVGLLGLQGVRDLVLAVEVFGELRPAEPLAGVSMARLQEQAHATATVARVLAARGEADLAYTAGLLSQLGRMVLMARATDRYIACLYLTQAELTLDEAEVEVFGVPSRELGAWLLALWGLPWEVVDAVRTSDAVPTPDGGTLPLVGAVHLAACFVEEAWSADDDEPIVIVTRDMLWPWGLESKGPLMRQLARSLVRGLMEPPLKRSPPAGAAMMM